MFGITLFFFLWTNTGEKCSRLISFFVKCWCIQSAVYHSALLLWVHISLSYLPLLLIPIHLTEAQLPWIWSQRRRYPRDLALVLLLPATMDVEPVRFREMVEITAMPYLLQSIGVRKRSWVAEHHITTWSLVYAPAASSQSCRKIKSNSPLALSVWFSKNSPLLSQVWISTAHVLVFFVPRATLCPTTQRKTVPSLSLNFLYSFYVLIASSKS